MMPKTGDKAPHFEGIDEQGRKINLSDYSGKKVILYFYPKDDTPGCTLQAANLRDHHQQLQEQGYVVLGVSSDSCTSHQKFKEKYSLPFILLADTDKRIQESYGVWVEKSTYGRKHMGTARTTFVIDEKGVIADVITKVDTKEHTAQVLSPKK